MEAFGIFKDYINTTVEAEKISMDCRAKLDTINEMYEVSEVVQKTASLSLDLESSVAEVEAIKANSLEKVITEKSTASGEATEMNLYENVDAAAEEEIQEVDAVIIEGVGKRFDEILKTLKNPRVVFDKRTNCTWVIHDANIYTFQRNPWIDAKYIEMGDDRLTRTMIRGKSALKMFKRIGRLFLRGGFFGLYWTYRLVMFLLNGFVVVVATRARCPIPIV